MTYANAIGYTDITPYEVIRTVSPTCLEVREMSATLDPTWTPDFVVGGFSAHCQNNGDQRWLMESNPAGRVVKIRFHCASIPLFWCFVSDADQNEKNTHGELTPLPITT